MIYGEVAELVDAASNSRSGLATHLPVAHASSSFGVCIREVLETDAGSSPALPTTSHETQAEHK